MFKEKRRRLLWLLIYVLAILIVFLMYQSVVMTKVQTVSHAPTTYIASNDTYTIKQELNEEVLTNEEASKKYKEEQIGTIYIPSVDMQAPILQGASNYDEDMQKVMKHTIGHEPESYLPGEGREIVLSGHREEQFGALEDVKKGDLIIVNILDNQYLYEVLETKIVLPEGDEAIEYVRGKSDEESLVMYTCYPFSPISQVTNRYVVKAKKIDQKELEKEEAEVIMNEIEKQKDKYQNKK